MNHTIITKEEYLNKLSNSQIVSRITEIMVELLKISEYQQNMIQKKEFRNISGSQEYIRALIKELEEFEIIASRRVNLKENVQEAKREKLKKTHKKLLEILEKNRVDTVKIISINKLAMEAISSAIAHQKKFELGYDHLGKLPKDHIVKKNTSPLNLNQKC